MPRPIRALIKNPPGTKKVNAAPAAVTALLMLSSELLNAAAPFWPSYMALPAARPAPARFPSAPAVNALALSSSFARRKLPAASAAWVSSVTRPKRLRSSDTCAMTSAISCDA